MKSKHWKESKEFFSRYIQNLQFDELLAIDPATLPNESQRNIRANSELLLQRLGKSFSGQDALCDFGAFLVQRCFLVAVSTPSQKSCLPCLLGNEQPWLGSLPSDIIKADVVGKIFEADQDEYTERWEDMEVRTGRSGYNDLFGHIRMIYTREKAKKTLLEEFREKVLPAVDSPEQLIATVLEPYSDAYLVAKTAQYVSTENAQEIERITEVAQSH